MKTSQESGIVLVIVLIIIMIMSIYGATIFSMSMSQSKSSRAQVDQIVAEQLAKGYFWSTYNEALGAEPTYVSGKATYSKPDVIINNRTYHATVIICDKDSDYYFDGINNCTNAPPPSGVTPTNMGVIVN